MRGFLRLAAACVASVGMGVLSGTPSVAPASLVAPALVAPAIVAHAPMAASPGAPARPLSSIEMLSVRGAGWRSALWEGIKAIGEAVIILGVAYLVDQFCGLHNVNCAFVPDAN
jgi:hypothetical protein